MRKMWKDALILFAITLLAGLILGAVYQVTKGPIAQQEEKAIQEANKAVFADAADFVPLEDFDAAQAAEAVKDYPGAEIEKAMCARDAEGKTMGYVLTVVSHGGYGGDIRFTMGIQNDGTVNGISFLELSETAGLGMRADEVLTPQFAGKKVESFEYTKTGAVSDSQIDAISGATITTSAVTGGVNAGLSYFHSALKGGDGNE